MSNTQSAIKPANYFNAVKIKCNTGHYLIDWHKKGLFFGEGVQNGICIELKSLNNFMNDLPDSFREMLEFDVIHVDKPDDYCYEPDEMYSEIIEDGHDVKNLQDKFIECIDSSSLSLDDQEILKSEIKYRSNFFTQKAKHLAN